MKRKLSFLFLSALTIPFFMGSCSDDKEEQEVKPATDLVVDNNSVTLLQGDEITVSITSGNGDYYVKPFDENVATATINGNKVTIKATENSQLEENNRTETTILIVDGRKKVARVLVRVAKLWNLTVDAPEEGFDLFIGEKRLVKILTGNGDYQISIPEGADKFLEVGELSGQVIPLTAKFETGADPVNITITDKKGKTITIPVVVNIVDLTLKSNEATFAEPDAESQYISIERGNGGYSFTYQVGDGEPTTDATIVEATEKENLITLKPKARGDVKVIVTDQKGSVEEIAVKVNPYNLKLENDATSLIIGGYEASTEIAIARGNGDYKLAQLTEDNKVYLKTAELVTEDGTTKLKLTGKKLGTTTLESFNPLYTIGSQIVEAIVLHQKKSKQEAEHMAVELLREVGIAFPEKRIKEYPHQMSGGMLQRAMIAMALSCRPKLLIADEPTTALDVTIQDQIIKLLKRLKKELDMSLVLVTHDLGVASQMCDHIAVMYAGRIMEMASADEIFEHPQNPYTYGLMRAIPSLQRKGQKLYSIDQIAP